MRLVRKAALAAVLATVAATASAVPAPVPVPPVYGLYNTGLDNAGNLLAGSVADSHWKETFTSTYSPLTTIGFGAWLGYDGLSSWLSANPFNGVPIGTYVASTTFDLSNYDLGSVSIDGRCSVDNVFTNIKLNGQVLTGANCAGFNAWGNFTMNSGFVSGINTLEITYYNQGSQGGFRAEFTQGAGGTSVPEPTSLALLGVGLAGLIASRRRKTA